MSINNIAERLREIRHVALDMDGTLYLGGTLFPYTVPFLAGLRRAAVGYSFLTNNPSLSVDEYVEKLRTMGIEASRREVYTSALATIDHIRVNYPAARNLFILGTPGMVAEFEAAGFRSCADSPDDVPDAVVVGFDKTLVYSRLCRAAWWITQGLPYIATNPDKVCPTDLPVILPDCAAICACLEKATGRKPSSTLGKPDPDMLSGVMKRHGLHPGQIAMVGDRIYTDVAMARNAGAFGVLVLSGETNAQEAEKSPVKPDLTVENIGVLGEVLRLSRK